MQTFNFEIVLDRIVEIDPRYRRDAYLFVREALDFTQHNISKANQGEIRHITGQELLEGIRRYAVEQYGPMAMDVLNEWGVVRCEDFGDIVFNLVDHNLLKKTESDSRDDFAEGYDFFEAFRKPFLPSHKLTPRTTGRSPR